MHDTKKKKNKEKTMNLEELEHVIAWAKADDNIRAVILEGSCATQYHEDALSDYDLNIYTHHPEQYLNDAQWIYDLGDVILYKKTQFAFYDDVIPMRLVLFRQRRRIDFSFWSPTVLADLTHGRKIYESYQNGYRVLVDKDQQAVSLPVPDGTGFVVAPPDRAQFMQTLYDVWFEAYAAARQLARGDVWYAKLIENRSFKDGLFMMALWHHQSTRAWLPDPTLHLWGKRFEHWASEDLRAAIAEGFSPYDVEATWRSVLNMVELFNRLARDTAAQLHIPYPEEAEAGTLAYLQTIQEFSRMTDHEKQ